VTHPQLPPDVRPAQTKRPNGRAAEGRAPVRPEQGKTDPGWGGPGLGVGQPTQAADAGGAARARAVRRGKRPEWLTSNRERVASNVRR
jgi:hypothetical protein